jgi:phosphate transport system substrate-binding protein
MAADQLVQTRKEFPAAHYFSNAVLPFPGFPKRLAAITSAVILTSLLTPEAQSQTTLRGGGATFPYPMYAKWFAEFHKLHPDIEIEYEPIGSGAGVREITAGVFDFGASDGPMNNSQLKEYRAKRGMEVLHFPTVLGAVVPMYNVPEAVAELKFTSETLADIFSR